ncbi:hypothetical protein V2J09_018213 [Rumex salicifolius]
MFQKLTTSALSVGDPRWFNTT